MFKRILIPTDGSALSLEAAAAGVQLARALGAHVTAYCAVSPLRQEFYGDDSAQDPFLLRLKREALGKGARYVGEVERLASTAGVPFDSRVDAAEPTYKGIIDAARSSRSDLVFIGSHGQSGLSGVLLGSVAAQVINHSTIPVLVYRLDKG